jgi:hypothetical protein
VRTGAFESIMNSPRKVQPMRRSLLPSTSAIIGGCAGAGAVTAALSSADYVPVGVQALFVALTGMSAAVGAALAASGAEAFTKKVTAGYVTSA